MGGRSHAVITTWLPTHYTPIEIGGRYRHDWRGGWPPRRYATGGASTTRRGRAMAAFQPESVELAHTAGATGLTRTSITGKAVPAPEARSVGR